MAKKRAGKKFPVKRRSSMPSAALSNQPRFSPEDPQQVSSMLIPDLVHSGRLDQAESLLNRYESDRGAIILYSRALCMFKKYGEEDQRADDALSLAIQGNPHVFEMLCCLRPQAGTPGELISANLAEAQHYMTIAMESWIQAEGSLTWIGKYLRRKVRSLRLSATFPGL